VGPNSRSITRFDCRAAVCLPDKVYECLKSQETTGTAFIGLKHYFIDTAIKEWRKRLLVCVRIVSKHFKQFYCRQLKNGQLDKLSTTVSEI